jgi:hypothetical protein
MDWTDGKKSGMICGSANAEKRVYKKLVGKSGRIWLVAIQENAADNIYVSGGKHSQGFAGRTLTFKVDDGSDISLAGPWHSNSAALLADTGVDVRDKYLTFGVIGLGREYGQVQGLHPITIKDVIHVDSQWMLGTYDRIDVLAQQHANKLGKAVAYFIKSKGGTTSGFTKPEVQGS